MSEEIGAAGWAIAVCMSFAWFYARQCWKLYEGAYEKMLANVKWWERFHAETMAHCRGWQSLYEDAKRKRD